MIFSAPLNIILLKQIFLTICFCNYIVTIYILYLSLLLLSLSAGHVMVFPFFSQCFSVPLKSILLLALLDWHHNIRQYQESFLYWCGIIKHSKALWFLFKSQCFPFFPRSVIICTARFLEYTTIASLYRIIPIGSCTVCEIRNESSYSKHINFMSFKW